MAGLRSALREMDDQVWKSAKPLFVFLLSDSKASMGTNSAAEAAKILAENRRLMREQKEKEEQLRIQKEEEEK